MLRFNDVEMATNLGNGRDISSTKCCDLARQVGQTDDGHQQDKSTPRKRE